MFSEPDLKLSDISKRFSAVKMLQRGAIRHFEIEWIILIKRTVLFFYFYWCVTIIG